MRAGAVLVSVALVACADRGGAPARVPAKVDASSTVPASATVGSVVGEISVKVSDASGNPVPRVVVSFSVTAGGGKTSPTLDTTGTDGTATSTFTIGTEAGTNEVTTAVSGFAPAKFSVNGTAGVVQRIVVAPRSVRIAAGVESTFVTGVSRDAFGNAAAGGVAWIARDPSLVNIGTAPNNQIVIRVLRRPGQTYVVGSNANVSDSVLVTIADAALPCAGTAAPVTLPVGGVVPFDSGVGCVHADADGAEYALIANYNTGVGEIFATIDVTSTGSTLASAAFPGVATNSAPATDASPRASFELALRHSEEREMPARVAGARAWYAARPPALRSDLRMGDVVPMNVNAFDFCSAPALHDARVAAITEGAIILTDVENPAGGFSDAELREFGILLDTLVNPVHKAAFGTPSDIDGNGRVVIFFTRAVNELTPLGSPSGIVLGFYYSRDLLPRESAFGACPGSNVAEMFYVIVPDPNGSINGNTRSKAFVQSVAAITIGHEYQHLINASRRMYVTRAPRVTEEVWLNEGLSHIAEELLFYRASGLLPRQNIDESVLAGGSQTRTLFDVYQRNNFARYREFLRFPEATSPLALDDRLATRGATWSFLRYVADRARPTDGDFWYRLVNSQLTGVPNLDAALAEMTPAFTTRDALHDWSISVLADDVVSGIASIYRQPSWNFPSAMPAVGLSFLLAPRLLFDGVRTSSSMPGGGSLYTRFAVPRDRDALLQLTGSSGSALPPGMRLSVVRTR